jgi:hypothetical protein
LTHTRAAAAWAGALERAARRSVGTVRAIGGRSLGAGDPACSCRPIRPTDYGWLRAIGTATARRAIERAGRRIAVAMAGHRIPRSPCVEGRVARRRSAGPTEGAGRNLPRSRRATPSSNDRVGAHEVGQRPRRDPYNSGQRSRQARQTPSDRPAQRKPQAAEDDLERTAGGRSAATVTGSFDKRRGRGWGSLNDRPGPCRRARPSKIM